MTFKLRSLNLVKKFIAGGACCFLAFSMIGCGNSAKPPETAKPEIAARNKLDDAGLVKTEDGNEFGVPKKGQQILDYQDANK